VNFTSKLRDMELFLKGWRASKHDSEARATRQWGAA